MNYDADYKGEQMTSDCVRQSVKTCLTHSVVARSAVMSVTWDIRDWLLGRQTEVRYHRLVSEMQCKFWEIQHRSWQRHVTSLDNSARLRLS